MAIVRRLVVRPERARPGGEPTNGKLAVRASLIQGSRQTGPQFLGVGQMPQHRPDAPSGGPQIEERKRRTVSRLCESGASARGR